jgi:hypothetical protein
MSNGLHYGAKPDRCHLMHLNHNKYRFQAARSYVARTKPIMQKKGKYAPDPFEDIHGHITELNAAALFLKRADL